LTTGLFAVVDPPPAGPPRGATLLRSANIVNDPDLHWLQGLRWRPLVCGSSQIGQGIEVCAQFSGFTHLSPPANVDYNPPSVAVGIACSAISGEQEMRDTIDRASALLDRCETLGIARELWRGAVATGEAWPNDFLANTATLTQIASGSSVSVLDALADLENYLASCGCGGTGMIHATAQTVTIWKHLQLIDKDPGGRLSTVLGTTVVADPGYDGSAPNGTVDATGASAWAYATGMIDVRRGPVQLWPKPDALERGVNPGNNDFNAYAYRPFAATFDPCCHGGVLIDMTTLT
jgi:hypothetical protein